MPEVKDLPAQFDPSASSLYWHLAPAKDKDDPAGEAVARALHRAATDRETQQTPRRWSNYVFARLMTGRPSVAAFAYGMAKRPPSWHQHYEEFEFGSQKSGLSASLGDVYVNRLLSHKTYVDLVPDQGNLYQQRKQAIQVARWTDGAFDTTGFWDAWKLAGLDAIYYGTGVLAFDGDDDTKQVLPEAVHMDELLFANIELPFNDQKEVIRRRYVDRYQLWAKYADDPEAQAAIIAAPPAYPAFWFGPTLNTTNVIPLVEGHKLGSLDGGKGRHTVAVQGYTLVDEEFAPDTLPYEAFHFIELPGSTWGQGLAEITLQYSEWVDELLAIAHESDIRAGRGKWFVDETSNVNYDDLDDTIGNVVTHLGKRPEFDAPDAVSPTLMQRVHQLIEMAMTRAHVSMTAVKGEVPKQLESGEALSKFAEIEDANFAEMLGRIETFVKRSALQYIRLGKTLKPKVVYSGRTKQLVDWPKLEMDGDRPLNITAYNVGRFGQTISAKLQKLQQLRQQGDITRQQYLRYLQVANTEGLLDGLNARTDVVDMILDDLVFGDEYVAPPSFCDLDYAITATEDRYSLERQFETPEGILDRLLMFRGQLIELRDQSMPKEQNNLPAPPAEGAPAATPPMNVDLGNGLPLEAMNAAPTPTGLPAPPIPIQPSA